LAVDEVTYQQAWRNAGGTGAPPPGFTDPGTPGSGFEIGNDNDHLLFHESIQNFSMNTGAREPFLQQFGDFMEEGITEGLTRRHLGPQAARSSYDRHVRFIQVMEERLGVSTTTIERAYLDGHLNWLQAAIRAGFGGDSDLAAGFIMSLRNLNAPNVDAAALRDAL
jgi:hypothetical protein